VRKRNQIVSALSPLAPISILNIRTGEYESPEYLQEKISVLIEAVHAETQRAYITHESSLLASLAGYAGTPQPAEYARQAGYSTSLVESLPKTVKAKSRVEKLVQYKLVSETASYVLNPNPRKEPHTFSRTLNLGAVDKQMASLSLDGSELNLVWKCWDEEYYLTFQVPAYVLNRKLVKFSLPLIKQSKKTEQFEFIFSIVEETKTRKGYKHTAGIDLGIVKPYSMVVVNDEGQRVASYEASPRLVGVARKQQRLREEKHRIHQKIKNRATRGLESPDQQLELERVRDKSTRLTKTLALQVGAEIADRLAKHNGNLIQVENLKWLSGHQGSKIGYSRWAHSQQQEAIQHATSRIGYKMKRVNAKNTSQVCNKCGSTITHDTKKRTVWCAVCRSSLDRDFNAAMNIAKQKQTIFPASQKLNGGVTSRTDVTSKRSKEAFSGTIAQPRHMARLTT